MGLVLGLVLVDSRPFVCCSVYLTRIEGRVNSIPSTSICMTGKITGFDTISGPLLERIVGKQQVTMEPQGNARKVRATCSKVCLAGPE